MGKKLVENQVIVQWHRPSQEPKEGEIVVATVSYNVGSCHCDHVLEEVWWWKEIGYELADGDDVDNLVVHAWCDLEPYGGD